MQLLTIDKLIATACKQIRVSGNGAIHKPARSFKLKSGRSSQKEEKNKGREEQEDKKTKRAESEN